MKKNKYFIIIIFILISNLTQLNAESSTDSTIPSNFPSSYDADAVVNDIQKAIIKKDYTAAARIFERIMKTGYSPRPDIAVRGALAYRKLDKNIESEKILLALWHNIQSKKAPAIDFIIKELFPGIMFTFKKTNKNDEARKFFAEAAEFFKNSKDYQDIKKYIYMCFYSQFDLPQKEISGLKFKSLSGKDIDIADYKGKYTLIDFWATWCPPCVNEIPSIIKIYNRYKPTNKFDIIGISLDSDENILLNFINKYKIGWEQYFDGKGWENKIAVENGIQSIPAIFLLDGEGKIMFYGLREEMLFMAINELLE